MSSSPKVARTNGQLAAAHRYWEPGSPKVIEAERNHAAAKLEKYITEIIEAAPPLTSEQQSTLVAIILGGAK